MVDTANELVMAKAAEMEGCLAALMYVCLKDDSGLAKLDRTKEATPTEFVQLMESHHRIGVEKGMAQLIYSDTGWHHVECTLPLLQNSLRSTFDDAMASYGIH
jgi:hypothetical protein